MTTPSYSPEVAVSTAAPAQRRASRPATVVDAVRAEWIKFHTVRSTYVILAVAVFLAIVVGGLISWAAAANFASDPTEAATWDPEGVATSGVGFAQLAILVLGVMAVTSEYASGMIRTSLAAVPRRWRWLASKCVVYTLVVLVVGEIITFAAFLIGQPIIRHWAPTVSLSDPGVLRAVIGGGLFAAVLTLVAIGIGALVRNTAGGIAIMVAVLFVLPAVSAALPTSVRRPVQKYWPTDAGSQIASVTRGAHDLGPWAGFGIFVAFAVIVLAFAFWLLERRDA